MKFCIEEKHDLPCPQPCPACEDEGCEVFAECSTQFRFVENPPNPEDATNECADSGCPVHGDA